MQVNFRRTKGSVLVAAFIAVLCACVIVVPAFAQSSNSVTAPSDTASQAILGQPTAFASAQANYEFIPGGISRHNAQAAWSKVSSRLAVDSNMAQAIASQAGAASFNHGDYRTVGFGRASPGTTNSSVLSNGRVVPAGETANCHVGARVLILIHKVTGKRLEICTACSNPRLGGSSVQPIPQRPWRLGTVLPFHRQVTRPIKCPDGRKIGSLKITLKGVVRGRTWGTVQGRMTAKLKLKLKLKLKAVVKVKCAPPAKPVVTPPPPPAVNNNITINNSNQQQQNQGQNQAQQQCAIAGGVWVNGKCDMSIVILQQQCEQQGGFWNSQTQKCIMPTPTPSPTPTPTPSPTPTPTPTPPPKVGKPTANAVCPPNFGAGLDVSFSNGSDANADVAFYVNGQLKVTLAPGGSDTQNVAVAEGGTITVTGKVQGNVVFTKSFTRNCPAPPPPKAHAKLVKKAFVDGNSKTLAGGEFSFSVSVNGQVKFSTTNAATGSARDLGDFNAGDDVEVCETNSDGYTPDDNCVSHTMSADETFTFTIVNRKTTSKPQPHATASAPCPSSGDSRTVTVTLTNTGNADAVNVAVEVTGAANSPASFTVHPGQTLTPTFSTSTDIDVRVRAMFGGDTLYDQTFPKCEKPPTPPTANNVTQPQEVYVNETYPNICADVSAPAGHSVRVVFSAKFGSFPDSTFNYSGGFARPCKTYHAPGDVTPTGKDTITVTVYDLTTGLNASSSSDPFDVWANTPNP
jgi:hypothetical protein